MKNLKDPYGADRLRGSIRKLARQANRDAERMRREREQQEARDAKANAR